MEPTLKLFMVMLGCKPKGRLTEQHDIFFGVGHSLKDLMPQIDAFWPEAAGNWHIDAWREVTSVGGHRITVVAKKEKETKALFFLNLGGYRRDEFEEYHYKLLVVAETMAEAIKTSKQTAFYKHHGFAGANSHVDDKYGIDVDDSHKVEDILASQLADQYSLEIAAANLPEDKLHIGYLPSKKL